MSNLDKDIQELAERFIDKLLKEKYEKPSYDEIVKIARSMTTFYSGIDGKNATTLVHSEDIRKLILYIDYTENDNRKLNKELETYKKIAEKLADKLVEIDDGCKHIPTEICNEYSNGRCIQCIIDWARKEVDK